MKKLLLVLIFVLFYTSVALAHPPSDIKVKAIDATQVEVTVLHGTGNPDAHHIKEVAVSLNGQKVISQNFSTQQTNDAQKAVYNLPELIKNPQAKITIYAVCNKGGDMTKDFVLGK